MSKIKKIFSRRSFIFTPPLKINMFDKAVKSGVDIVCLELEDGIAPSDKLFARQNALKIINKKKDYNNIEVLIRINSIREIFGILDITAILNNKTQTDGMLVPKIKSPEELKILENNDSSIIPQSMIANDIFLIIKIKENFGFNIISDSLITTILPYSFYRKKEINDIEF